MGKVDAVRGIEFIDGNCVDVPSGGHVVRQNGLHPLVEWLTAGPAAENVIKNLRRGVVLVLRGNDLVAALPQIICRRACGCLQGSDCILFLMAAFGSGQRLILENEKKAPCDCLTGAKLPNELQVVFLQDTAARILLMLQLPADGIQMPVNVRTLCQCLELHLDRGNFQIGNKGVNDAALLSRAAQQEVDGNHLYNLDIAVISCINDAVLNLLDRDIVRQGIERLNGFFLLQEGLELRHAALLQINRKSAAAFGERRIFCFAVAFLLLSPAGQQRFSIFAALRPIA